MKSDRSRNEHSNHIVEEIYQEKVGKIVKFAYGFLDRDEDVKDFVQTVFTRFYRGFSLHTDYSKEILEGYLFKTMQNLRTDIFLKRSRERKSILWEEIEDMADSQNLEDAVFSSLELEEVVQQINNLPPRYALFLQMKYFGDFTDDEIAGALGVKKSSLRMIQSRARAKLKELCGKEDPSYE